MGKSDITSHHFDRVASTYAHVRDTDPDVIETIIANLPQSDRPLDVIDMGCGTGRYTSIMAKKLEDDFRLFCSDHSSAMLSECRKRMNREFPSTDIHYCRVSANDLPFADVCFDAVVTFNAVHHFDLDRFVKGASRVLRPGGLLSIYTRTPAQNARTIWGRHFPSFSERETRLYRCERLQEAIAGVSGVELQSVHEFEFIRTESRESLLNRVRNFHYSTFALYPPNQLMRAMATFSRRLSKLSSGSLIEHTAENILVLARRA
ncbi:MAG: class I SAM-dependent methyltransferase [Bacteroidota bacterium]